MNKQINMLKRQLEPKIEDYIEFVFKNLKNIQKTIAVDSFFEGERFKGETFLD